jgi:hypothetical protein
MEDQGKKVRIATIDTILSFILSFIYVEQYKADRNRLLCIATMLFSADREHGLSEKGILQRFSLKCMGSQPTMQDIMREKQEKWKELKQHPNAKEEELFFFKYEPGAKKGSSSKKMPNLISSSQPTVIDNNTTELKVTGGTANHNNVTEITNQSSSHVFSTLLHFLQPIPWMETLTPRRTLKRKARLFSNFITRKNPGVAPVAPVATAPATAPVPASDEP